MAPHEPSPVLLPEVEARALYPTGRLRLHVLRPPYPALGLGDLRVLRIREFGDETQIVAGYDGYQRLTRDAGQAP